MKCACYWHALFHWGRVTHICVSTRQAIIWTNAGILLIRTLATNFSEILGKIHHFHSRKCIWKCRLRKHVVNELMLHAMCFFKILVYTAIQIARLAFCARYRGLLGKLPHCRVQFYIFHIFHRCSKLVKEKLLYMYIFFIIVDQSQTAWLWCH